MFIVVRRGYLQRAAYEYQRDKVVTSPKMSDFIPKMSDFTTLKRGPSRISLARPLKPMLGRSYEFLVYFLLLSSSQLPLVARGAWFL